MGLSCLAEVVDEDGELLGPACPSIMCASNIGSGEEGAEPGEGGPCPRNSRRFFRRFISSLRLLAICSGVSTDSLNSEGFVGELHSPVSLLLGLQPWGWPMGTHLLLLMGLLGEWRGSKSRERFKVTQAILLSLNRTAFLTQVGCRLRSLKKCNQA